MTERQQAFHDLAPRVVDLDVSNNGIVSYAGRRLVFFHTDMVAKLFQNMEDLAGPIMQRKIKEFGSEAGHTIASKLDAEFRDSSKFEDLQLLLDPPELDKLRSIQDTSNIGQIEKILGLSTYDGWIGDVDIEELRRWLIGRDLQLEFKAIVLEAADLDRAPDQIFQAIDDLIDELVPGLDLLLSPPRRPRLPRHTHQYPEKKQ